MKYIRNTLKRLNNNCYSPEKLCHNRICYPSNRSKQVQETHTAFIADKQYTRQSLNEKQHTWLHRQCHEWHVAEKVNQSTMVEVIARRSLRINTLHTELRPSIESHHRPTVSVIAPWRTLLGGSLHNNSNFQGVYSNFAVCSVCRWCKPCEFLGFVWTGCYPIM